MVENNTHYAFFDGDNIGDKVETLLIEGRIFEASKFSEDIKAALSEIEQILKPKTDIEIIIAGGDDLLRFSS